jgi:hypothetical protein
MLSAGLISIDGFTGPVDVGSCIFERWGPRETLKFDVVVVDATTPRLEPVYPAVIAEER